MRLKGTSATVQISRLRDPARQFARNVQVLFASAPPGYLSKAATSLGGMLEAKHWVWTQAIALAAHEGCAVA